MWIQTTVQKPCPVCGKETTLDATEPHPTHTEIELCTYRCVDCGLVRTTSVQRRPGRLPRAA
jgi:uncharacterized Zn finger protein